MSTWAVALTTGVVLSWILLLRRTSRLGYQSAPVLLWVVLAFPAGAVGAATLAQLVARGAGWHVLGAGINGAGLTVIGAVLGCLVFTTVYIRMAFREAPWRLLDAVAFTLPLALIFGRVGCLFAGCCFGIAAPAWAPDLLTIAVGSYAPVSDAAVAFVTTDPATRLWNLPLLLGGAALATLVVSEVMFRRAALQSWPAGTVLGMTLVADALFRLPLEHLRSETHVLGAFNPWQLLLAGVVLVALTATGLARWSAHGRKPADVPSR